MILSRLGGFLVRRVLENVMGIRVEWYVVGARSPIWCKGGGGQGGVGSGRNGVFYGIV